MSLPKLLVICAVLLFSAIGLVAWFKGGKADKRVETTAVANKPTAPVTVALGSQVTVVPPEAPKPRPQPKAAAPVAAAPAAQKKGAVAQASKPRPLPEADLIQRFFIRDAKQFPIVETIVYKSHVAWLKGRPAWLSDYAGHYRTSRHFIARSLNGKREYFKQDLVEGNRFNVLKPDKNLEFYLVVDITRGKMWFYYTDLDAKEKLLVKSYDVGVGRLDSSTESGMLTPLGKYTLGDHIGIYKPKSKGTYNGQDVEMITVFGTRWIPFGDEVSGCTAPATSLGIHGCPWVADATTGELKEDISGIGQHTSDGCIRLRTADMEELFAIIISRPTTIELVRDFFDADGPPGKEPTAAG